MVPNTEKKKAIVEKSRILPFADFQKLDFSREKVIRQGIMPTRIMAIIPAKLRANKNPSGNRYTKSTGKRKVKKKLMLLLCLFLESLSPSIKKSMSAMLIPRKEVKIAQKEKIEVPVWISGVLRRFIRGTVAETP